MMKDHIGDEVIKNCEYTFDEISQPGPSTLPQKKNKRRRIAVSSDCSDDDEDFCGGYEKPKRLRLSS